MPQLFYDVLMIKENQSHAVGFFSDIYHQVLDVHHTLHFIKRDQMQEDNISVYMSEV